jgi:hypothetical protein
VLQPDPVVSQSNEIRSSAVVQAPPARVYGILADYRDGHPRIVPPKYFTWMDVDAGGVGEGTAIRFGMRILGSSHTLRATITEPEPGRVLVETYPDTGVVTTFLVEPVPPAAARVEIRTRLSSKRGLMPAIERFVSRRVLPGIYAAELERIAEHAEGRKTHPPLPRLER